MQDYAVLNDFVDKIKSHITEMLPMAPTEEAYRALQELRDYDLDQLLQEKMAEQAAEKQPAEQTHEEIKAYVLRAFQSIDKHPCYVTWEDARNVRATQAVEVYELLRALEQVLPDDIHRSFSERLIDEWGLVARISEQEVLDVLSDMDILN